MSDEQNAGGGSGQAQDNTNAGAGAAGSATPSFIETLPEDIRGNEVLKGFDSAEKLARAHLETLGKLPAVPEKPEAYEIKVPEGHPVNEMFLGQFKTWAHQHGLSQEQAAGLAGAYIALEQSQMAEVTKADEAAMNQLKTDWGDKFKDNWAQADKAIAEFCTESEQKFLLEFGMRNAAPMVRMFQRIGEAMSEDKLAGGGARAAGGGGGQMAKTAGGEPLLDFPSMEKKE